VGRLPEQEREVIMLRYGLDGEPLSLAAVEGQLGVSAERVRRIAMGSSGSRASQAEALERLSIERELQGLAELAA
jgi:DNA-directed RNA polymerase sigma subunit (sigma70/sigma32)